MPVAPPFAERVGDYQVAKMRLRRLFALRLIAAQFVCLVVVLALAGGTNAMSADIPSIGPLVRATSN